MPELKHISPMLDGFVTGQAISSHDGVCCYPAIREDTAEKYIVKVIAIPASAVQTEALLLTGAFSDPEAVKEYYRELAEGVQKEANILSELSQLEGFLGYEQVQIAATEEGDGFEVYLLCPYRKSVETIMSKEPLTHLAIVNMGLDLCNALAACRRAGFVCADLKPSNIFHDDKNGYRIGDLGFVALTGLRYASLPSKYCSCYTAPEARDPMAELNATIDIYSLGLVLYAAYNGGTLPRLEDGSADTSAPPVYADYEMAEIILKACATDPAARWQEPAQIGQALVSYMQRNSVNDVPIIPPIVEIPEPEEEEPEEFLPETDDDEEFLDSDTLISTNLEEQAADTAADGLDGSDDTDDIMAQADELMTLVPPAPVIAPQPIDVPMPEPIVPEDEEPEEAPAAETSSDEEPVDIQKEDEDTVVATAPVAEEESVSDEPQEIADEAEITGDADDDIAVMAPTAKKRRSIKWLLAPLLLLLVAAIIFGGWFFYNHYYLQNVEDLVIEGTEDSIVVKISSQIDETLLTVVCTDSYGNRSTSSVSAGIAVFDGLNPQTRYTVNLLISGFHQLTGKTTDSFTTAAQTDILTFDAITGPVDGSVILSITTSGPTPSQWNVVCQASGAQTIEQAFTGEQVTVTGLTVGKTYTFTLETADELYLAGLTSIKYTASNIIYAQELTITECHDSKLTVTWSAPEGTMVESWTVRCSDGSGYNKTVTVSDTTYTFTGMDHSTPCSVEVTAAGMTQSTTTSITANPITVWGYPFTVKDGIGIELRWTYTDVAPEGGWKLIWSADGSDPQMIESSENSATIPLFIPGGVYEVTLVAADGTYIFGNTFTLTLPEAENFNSFLVSADDMTCRVFRIPRAEEWTWQELTDEEFVSRFAVGESAGILISLASEQAASAAAIEITYILHSSDGVYLSTMTDSMVWDKMWESGACVLQLPSMPETAGEYVVSIYFGGAFVTEQSFAVAE